MSDDVYNRIEGYGHGSTVKLVRHRLKDSPLQHNVATRCGKYISRRYAVLTGIEKHQGIRSECKRCFPSTEVHP